MNHVVLASLVAFALSGVACKQSHEPGRSGAGDPPRPSTATATLPKIAVQQGPVWETGKHYRYHLKTSSLVSLGQAPLYDFDVTGTVDIVLTNHEKSADTLYLALESAELKSRVPGTQPDFDKLVATLKSPFFFELKAGLVSAGYLAKDLHPLAAAVFRSIAAALQVAPDPGGGTFTALEYDTTGQYSAEYSPIADARGWHKRKQRYLGILLADNHPKEAEGLAPRVEKSEGVIRLGAARSLESVELVDELSFSNAQAPMRSHVQVSLTLEGSKELGKQEPIWADLQSTTTRLDARSPYQSELGDENLDAAKMRGLTFEALLTQFENLAARPKPTPVGASPGEPNKALRAQTEEENRLFIALGTVLRTQPRSVERAVGSIRAKSPASDTLVDALGSAGSPQAQAALAKFALAKTYSDTLRNRAAIALSRTERPTLESSNTLLGLVDDEIVGTQALYGLGGYAKIYADTGRAEMAASIGDFLVKRLTGARSELRLIEALRAIANSAYLPALKAVQPLLLDPRTQVRVDAVRALQLMPASSVDEALADRLASDSARAVKLAAIEAMDERAPTDVLVAGLRGAAKSDDPHVRYRSVEMMIRWLPKRTELRDAIETVAKNEQEQKIRELAEAAL